MDREELTRIAREAGIRIHKIDDMHLHQISTRLLERFASLVAAAERERCANEAEGITKFVKYQSKEHYKFASVIAAAIRALQ